MNEYSLIEDQKYILSEILKIIDSEKPDGVLIAGDIYDKSQPSAEAVSLLDEFLSELCERGVYVYMISGNHDSAERVSYGEKVFGKQNIYISPVYDGSIKPIGAKDEYGNINIYPMPFIRLQQVKRLFAECECNTYTEALKLVVDNMNINTSDRNVILAHQFITGAEKCDSEEICIGALDNVDSKVFDDFDYVALGHIHRPQRVGRECVRYAGTPLKYSASEAAHKKSVTVVELKEKGNVEIREVLLKPLRDYKDIKGKLSDVLKIDCGDDYVRVTLTDEENLVDAYGKLMEKFPFMTELVFERELRKREESGRVKIDEQKDVQFASFYKEINGKEMTQKQTELVKSIFDEIEGDER
jgi:exonuclease SbcD